MHMRVSDHFDSETGQSPWCLYSRMLNWPRSLYWAQQRRREKLFESEGVGYKGRT